MKLSIVLPAYKEPYLQKTIDSLLENAETDDIEIIPVLDGYWQNPPLREDPRVHILHFGECRGMRAAINGGVALAKGKYIMKADAHCTFAKGYDKVLLDSMKDGVVMIPRRYKLDVEKWEVMPDRPIDYDKLIIMENPKKFHGEEWRTRAHRRKNTMVDETMSFQGSCWIMSRKWWDKVIGNLQEEGYGRFSQEPIEIGMKTWQAGGRVMVNKNTWYAHKHRKFNRTHNVTGEESKAGNDFALSIWMDEYEKLKARFGI